MKQIHYLRDSSSTHMRRVHLLRRPQNPSLSPQRLTADEVSTINDMFDSSEYRHVPTGTLAMLAQRLGKVFASASTWYRLARVHGWRRPRQRVHPEKPKVGIRATERNEIWHVDTTIVRLLDGSRAYIHAIIDNFSRKILAWQVCDWFNPSTTAELLLVACQGVENLKPTVVSDAGIENKNGKVDELIDSGLLKRLIAQTEITYSNSMIESWWRSLKHQWLFLNSLDSVATVRKLVSFYIDEHNTKLWHSAFRGQTPDEMYLDTGESIPQELEEARLEARRNRMTANRQQGCSACLGEVG